MGNACVGRQGEAVVAIKLQQPPLPQPQQTPVEAKNSNENDVNGVEKRISNDATRHNDDDDEKFNHNNATDNDNEEPARMVAMAARPSISGNIAVGAEERVRSGSVTMGNSSSPVFVATKTPLSHSSNKRASHDPSSSASSKLATNVAEVSLRIDEELLLEQEKMKRVVKLLLLGPSESGKSTVLKQFRIIHLDGYTPAELLARRPLVHRNVVRVMLQMLDAGRRFGVRLPSSELRRDAATIFSLIRRPRSYSLAPSLAVASGAGGGYAARELASDSPAGGPLSASLNSIYKIVGDSDHQIIADCELDGLDDGLPYKVYEAIERLWRCEKIQAIYERRSEYNLMDCAKYFLDDLDRLHDLHYVPTTADILATRVMTVSIAEIRFLYKELEFRVFDVGGQRSQRRKWIHLFDNVHAVIFIAAMAEYDQHMREDPSKNRLHDALELFGEVGNNKLFTKVHIILFLNKKDIFAEKIERIPLTACFPNYRYKNDYATATLYMRRKFERQIENKTKQVYTHLTCATDTEQVKFVTNSVNDMIISKNMKKSGMT